MGLRALWCCFLLPLLHSVDALGGIAELVRIENFEMTGDENLGPLATDLLNLTQVAQGSSDPSPGTVFPLVLAEEKTRRPDVLQNLKLYKDGWNITNIHYWTSVGFTGAGVFVIAFLWFISFGFAMAVHQCYKWGIAKDSKSSHWILILLLIFTCAASIGCILISVGQGEFHHEVLHTLNFVLNQTDFTVEILRNVTGFLSLAKTINVDHIILQEDAQNKIDKLNIDLDSAASTLSDKMNENSGKIRKGFYDVQCALIVVAAVMLLLAVLGFLLSFFRYQNAIYIFVLSGWILVVFTFVLCGVFVILNNIVSDTCTSMDEWVDNPHAKTALSNIIPCVDETTTNRTLQQSKEVTRELVNVVNTVIGTIANLNNVPPDKTFWYNQSGPLMPYLCSPYDSNLNDRQCDAQEVPLRNASLVWLNYTCNVTELDLCESTGRVTPNIQSQLVAAVNASYALDHYTPILLSLQDCNFVRVTFRAITTLHCPHLEQDMVLVSVGLGMMSAGVMFCLILWILYANRPQREEVFAHIAEQPEPSEVKIDDNSSNIPAIGA